MSALSHTDILAGLEILRLQLLSEGHSEAWIAGGNELAGMQCVPEQMRRIWYPNDSRSAFLTVYMWPGIPGWRAWKGRRITWYLKPNVFEFPVGREGGCMQCCLWEPPT